MNRQETNDTQRERQLLIALSSGDMKAFDALYDKYHKSLYGFALRLSKDSDEAEDLVQSVFVSVWELRESIDVEKSFRSYLFSIARNRFYDILRHKVAENRYIHYILQQYAYSSEPNYIEQHLEEKEFSTLINTLLDRVPERRRLIFKMSREAKLSYKQIAQKLQISENTVDTQIRNVLNFLRKELLKYMLMIIFSLLEN
jgi:RNA polymerase sigma-70 factor (ECF subfamily)